MNISNFALNYNKTIVLNYNQMLEISKAITSRKIILFERIHSSDDEIKDVWIEDVATLNEVSDILGPLIEEAVLTSEANQARIESQILDNDQEVQKFLEGK